MGSTHLNIRLSGNSAQRIELNGGSRNSIGLSTPVAYGSAKIVVLTTEEWNQRISYIPKKGEILVWSDRNVISGVPYAGLKIGDGLAYAVDLPFVGDDVAAGILQTLQDHISDTQIHITEEEREIWNNKINYDINGEELILTRL